MAIDTQKYLEVVEWFLCGGTIPQHARVRLSGAKLVLAGEGDYDSQLGTALQAGVLDQSIPVLYINAPGKRLMIGNGNILAENPVYTKAAGKVGTGAGMGERVGVALTDCSADNATLWVMTNH